MFMSEDWNTNLHTILNVVDTHRGQIPGVGGPTPWNILEIRFEVNPMLYQRVFQTRGYKHETYLMNMSTF
jgi:hypothetical protein